MDIYENNIPYQTALIVPEHFHVTEVGLITKTTIEEKLGMKP
jgi:hypothetical protein